MNKQEINELIAEKIMGLVKGKDFGTWGEHDWVKDEDGEIDTFAYDADTHNGPLCKRCGYCYCHHCEDGPQEECKKNAPNYYETFHHAWDVMEKLKERFVINLEIAYGDYECVLQNESESGEHLFRACGGEGETAQKAICNAALNSIGVKGMNHGKY